MNRSTSTLVIRLQVKFPPSALVLAHTAARYRAWRALLTMARACRVDLSGTLLLRYYCVLLRAKRARLEWADDAYTCLYLTR